jgi:hypothetical protein
VGSLGVAQQRQSAPGRRAVDQRDAQLVAEAARTPHLALATAAVEVAPVASLELAAGRARRASSVTLLTTGANSSISASRGIARRGRPFSERRGAGHG